MIIFQYELPNNSLNDEYQTLTVSNSSYFNSTSKTFDELDKKTPLSTSFVIFGMLISLITIIGNLFVIIVFSMERKLQKYSNYFILNLSIADLIIGFLVTGYIMLNLSNDTIKGPACTLWLTLDYVAGSASVLCIVVISFDRYLLIKGGLSYIAKQKVCTAILIITGVWGN